MVKDPDQTRIIFLLNFFKHPCIIKTSDKSFCTLYSTQYDLEELSATVFWPNKSIVQKFDDYKECREIININRPRGVY